MSRKVVLLATVQNLGARGLITPRLPEHYAKVLIRRGLAKPYDEKPLKNKVAPQIREEIRPVVDYSTWKKSELKAKLDELGVEYDGSAKKSELIALLE